uniref:Hyaluronidase n=1 Tax=Lates calcarifer TaxID=8187 RepID=A0A4W6G9S9_LATCA
MVLCRLLLRLLFVFLLLFSLSILSFTSLSPNSTRRNPLLQTLPPAVAAAGPILEDRPFIVVWNMPTSRCQKRYNIHLNLGDFDIVENRQQRFQGQKMTIFYRDRLGKYPYLSRDGRKVNGGIPQLGDLAAHLALTVTQMSGLLQPNFTGLAVIDWEEWRPLWERNFGSKMVYRKLSKELVRQERPDLSDRAVKLMARQKFEESARKFMEETLRSVVTDRPKGLWGFYGFPACFNQQKRKTDESYTGRCHRGTRQQNDRLSWLWQQSTALYPSIYLPQRLAGSMDAALMVRHRVLEALRVASLWRHNTDHITPVLSYARLAFTRSLTFLNKVGFVTAHKHVKMHAMKFTFFSLQFHTLQAVCGITVCVCVCVCVCMLADRPDAYTRGECIIGSRWSGAVGRAEICQVQGMCSDVCGKSLFMCVCV